MKLVNCENIRLCKNDSNLFFFTVGSTQIFVSPELIKVKMIRKPFFPFVEKAFVINTNYEINFTVTKKDNIIIKKLKSQDEKVYGKYLVFLMHPHKLITLTARREVGELAEGIESFIAPLHHEYFFIADDDTLFTFKWRNPPDSSRIAKTYGIKNAKLVPYIEDKELEGLAYV